jgi:hypothetical protein
VGAPKSGLGSTAFLPAIHLQLPRNLCPKPWFQLRPTHEKLRPKHVMTPQCDMTIDLMILTVLLRSMTLIYLPFLPSFLLPCTILSLNDQVKIGPPGLTIEISFGSLDSKDFKYQLLVSSDWISSEMEYLLTFSSLIQ